MIGRIFVVVAVTALFACGRHEQQAPATQTSADQAATQTSPAQQPLVRLSREEARTVIEQSSQFQNLSPAIPLVGVDSRPLASAPEGAERKITEISSVSSSGMGGGETYRVEFKWEWARGRSNVPFSSFSTRSTAVLNHGNRGWYVESIQ